MGSPSRATGYMVMFLLLVLRAIPLVKTADDLEVRHRLRIYRGGVAMMIEYHSTGKTSRRDTCQDPSIGFRSAQRREWLGMVFLTLPFSVAS
jgi:hypothetical protein